MIVLRVLTLYCTCLFRRFGEFAASIFRADEFYVIALANFILS